MTDNSGLYNLLDIPDSKSRRDWRIEEKDEVMNESCDTGNEDEADDDSSLLVGVEDYDHMTQVNDDVLSPLSLEASTRPNLPMLRTSTFSWASAKSSTLTTSQP
jgi:hypothetical protein